MQDNKELQLRYLEQKEQLDDLKNQVKILTKVNCIFVLNMRKKNLSMFYAYCRYFLKVKEYRKISVYLFML